MIALSELSAIICYIAILFIIGFWSARRHQTASDFIIGGRSLNFWLTAFSAHASDMSVWLFIGLPAYIFTQGLFKIWFAAGLVLFMFLNWLFIAPRLRTKTEEYNSLTFSSFFESRFHDTSGLIRVFSALISLIFYTLYIAAGAIGMGEIIQALFGIPYTIGMTIGLSLTVTYLFIGGYRTLAWVDCFQALFLLLVILLVPAIIFPKVGGWEGIAHAFKRNSLPLSIFPDGNRQTIGTLLFLLFSWGIGYFGQPHIVTKFMGIANPKAIRKSMLVGTTWQIIVLSAAILIGALAVPFFPQGIANPEHTFILMVKETFTPFLMAFILCAVLAATLSTMDSQILVLASSLTEDFYKRIFRKKAGSKELLWISRFFVLLSALFAYLFALFNKGLIFDLVFYAWSGLGASFGPILIFGLFFKKTNKYGAWAGILTGAIVVNIWITWIDKDSTLLAGFLLSSLAIYVVSWRTRKKNKGKGTQNHDRIENSSY